MAALTSLGSTPLLIDLMLSKLPSFEITARNSTVPSTPSALRIGRISGIRFRDQIDRLHHSAHANRLRRVRQEGLADCGAGSHDFDALAHLANPERKFHRPRPAGVNGYSHLLGRKPRRRHFDPIVRLGGDPKLESARGIG